MSKGRHAQGVKRQGRPTRRLGTGLRIALFVMGALAAAVAPAAAYMNVGVTTIGSYSAAIADSLGGGMTPTSYSLNGENVTIQWPASTTVHNGLTATGYTVTRYNAASGGTPTAATGGCSGTVSALTCTEQNVAPGSWWYTVTPKYDSWSGAESGRLAVTVNTPTFTITAGQTASAASGGSISGGSLTSFGNSENVTFHLDTAGGTTLLTSPSTVTTSGTGTASGFTITVPSGLSVGNHFIVAVGTSSLLTATSNNTFNVYGTASKLVFTTQPSGATAINTAFPKQPVVTVEDASGNTVTNWPTSITLTTHSGSTGALGGCTTAVAPVNGVATFSGCTWSSLGTGDSVTASSGALNAQSNLFNITGSATKVAFSTEPSTTATAGTAFATQPIVSVEDSSSRVVTADTTSTVVLSIGSGGAAGAALSCTSTLSVAVSYGVASYSGCSINLSSSSAYLLHATDGALTTANSTGVTVSAGAATQIVLSGPTSNLGQGGSQTYSATIEDALGNTVTSGADSSRSVTFAQTSGSGSVTGLGAFTASGGVATDIITASTVGSVTLQASATLTQGATSSNTLSFTVTTGPTITFPTTASPYNAGHNVGVETLHITGTGFQSGLTVTASGAFTINSIVSVTSTEVVVTLTGSGGNNAKGNLTMTNPDGGTVTTTNSLNNGGTYNG